ncbi:MAG: hypothetical protein K6T28_09510 [Acidothermus sp.]|nr:hypothetical protein [Acidothermus sp.]
MTCTVCPSFKFELGVMETVGFFPDAVPPVADAPAEGAGALPDDGAAPCELATAELGGAVVLEDELLHPASIDVPVRSTARRVTGRTAFILASMIDRAAERTKPR